MPRTILITGSSDGGLGAALAAAFHKNGDRVFATARNPAKMSSLKALGIETLSLDVLSEDSIKACVEQVSSLTGGSLDMLVNNAGAGYNMPVLDASIAQIQKQFEINVWSVVRVSQLFFPLLRNSQAGMLVNNTSTSSVIGLPFQGPYSASKAATSSLTATMRIELQSFGIRVIDLKTGGVKSKFFENAMTNNANATRLPETSLYAAGKDRVEQFLTEGPEIDFMDPDVWAGRVVRDLSKRNPPLQVWRGKGASQIWWGLILLPVGLIDGMLKKASGLDVVERKIKELQKREGKTK